MKAAFELQRQRDPRMFPAWAVLELCNLAFPTFGTEGVPLLSARCCAGYCLRAAYEVPPVPRHKLSPETVVLGFLRATVQIGRAHV